MYINYFEVFSIVIHAIGYCIYSNQLLHSFSEEKFPEWIGQTIAWLARMCYLVHKQMYWIQTNISIRFINNVWIMDMYVLQTL